MLLQRAVIRLSILKDSDSQTNARCGQQNMLVRTCHESGGDSADALILCKNYSANI